MKQLSPIDNVLSVLVAADVRACCPSPDTRAAKRERAPALQDARATDQIVVISARFWTGPALWRFPGIAELSGRDLGNSPVTRLRCPLREPRSCENLQRAR